MGVGFAKGGYIPWRSMNLKFSTKWFWRSNQCRGKTLSVFLEAKWRQNEEGMLKCCSRCSGIRTNGPLRGLLIEVQKPLKGLEPLFLSYLLSPEVRPSSYPPPTIKVLMFLVSRLKLSCYLTWEIRRTRGSDFPSSQLGVMILFPLLWGLSSVLPEGNRKESGVNQLLSFVLSLCPDLWWKVTLKRPVCSCFCCVLASLAVKLTSVGQRKAQLIWWNEVLPHSRVEKKKKDYLSFCKLQLCCLKGHWPSW